MEPALNSGMKYRVQTSARFAALSLALALALLPLSTAHAADLAVELRLPGEAIHPGQPALISAVLSGVEAGKLYSLVPPAEANLPELGWGSLEWRGLQSVPGETLPQLELVVTATDPGEVELPSLQLRAVAVADAAGLVGESVDLGGAVVVPTKPITITVSRDLTPYFTVGGVALLVALLVVAGVVLFRKSRKQEASGVDTSLSPSEQAREHVHAARRHRLDGDFYQFYLSLSRAASALNLEQGTVAPRLETRAQEVGYKGVRPTEDEMDGALKDIERALTQRNKDS